MWASTALLWLLVVTVTDAAHQVITKGLAQLLSPGATIAFTTANAPRYSDFDAPQPGAVVTVATEHDVLATVQFCLQHEIPFLAQDGGHGWATTFTLKNNGILINLAGIKNVTLNTDATEITLQGGALVSDLVAAAYNRSTLVTTGTCNCVGALGATLGGGFGNLLGQYGFSSDNLLSLNIVTPSGTAITVTPADTNYWWALRGAGPNFGIVTSAVMKAYPIPAGNLSAWTGPLIFSEDKLEALVQAMEDLHLSPQMNMFMYFLTSGSPIYEPIILLNLFYYGSEAAGRAAFASIYAIGPEVDETAIVPYDLWNAGGDSFCTKGGFKPSYGVGLKNLVPATWRAVWNEYVAFVALNGTGNSAVLLDAYSMEAARQLPDSTSAYPFRHTLNFNALASTSYTDASLDAAAAAWGTSVRTLLRGTSGLAANSTYINNGFGDEPLATVYGTSLARLQQLKKEIDPYNQFNQWFPLEK